MPRLALSLAVLSLACSLSVVAFFLGIPLGLLSLLLALGALRAHPPGSRPLRSARRALVVGTLGLSTGLAVWFIHVRAVQTAYRLPSPQQLRSDFQESLASATAPLPTAPARPLPLPSLPPPPKGAR